MRNKKVISLLLATALAFSMVGCGNAKQESEATGQSVVVGNSQTSSDAESASSDSTQELEPVTLRIYLGETPGADDKKVAEYVSNLPQVQALNVTVEFVKTKSEEYWEKLPLWLASNEQMDIMYDAGDRFISRMQQGAYADLSGYLEEDTDFYNAFPEELWAAATYKGGIYGLGVYKEMGSVYVAYCAQSVLDAANINAEDIQDFEDMEPILAALKEDETRLEYAIPKKYTTRVGLKDDFDILASDTIGIRREEGKTILNLYETEEFKQLIETMYDWNQKGYIAQDILTNYDGKVYTNYETLGLNMLDYAPTWEYIASANAGYEITPLYVAGDPVLSVNGLVGAIFGVCQKSENPERAYEFLKLWNTDPEVKNAITFGIPDVHYTLVDGQVKPVDNISDLYVSNNYKAGNNLISYTKVGEPINKYELYEEYNAKAILSSDFGFILDRTEISDKIANCQAVFEEYLYPLAYGFIEPEKGIAQLNEQLKAAGIDDIIAEAQEQFDAFLATK